MNTLVLTADYPPHVWSGIGRSVEALAEAVRRQGAAVTVIVAGGGPARRSASGVDVLPLSRTRFPVDIGAFDIVHLHSLGLGELAVEVKWRSGAPLVYTAHSLVHHELTEPLRRRFWTEAQRAVMRASDHVIFLTERERSLALADLPDLALRSSVLRNGVERAPAHLALRNAGLGPVVFAGRHVESKGVRLLCSIVERMSTRPRFRFVIAGGHGDVTGEALVADTVNRHPRTCRATGWLHPPDLEGLLAGAGVVVVPSSYEPFGMIALDAMRNGAPVLAADVGGLTEIVGDPHSGGELVPDRDPATWCRAISDLASDEARHDRLRRCGPRYVRQRYGADAVAVELMAGVYEPLAQRRCQNEVVHGLL